MAGILYSAGRRRPGRTYAVAAIGWVDPTEMQLGPSSITNLDSAENVERP